ncbi:MAG: hypothetical protein ACP6IU_05705 [Candidatus Asgardarchaeia archaeon]
MAEAYPSRTLIYLKEQEMIKKMRKKAYYAIIKQLIEKGAISPSTAVRKEEINLTDKQLRDLVKSGLLREVAGRYYVVVRGYGKGLKSIIIHEIIVTFFALLILASILIIYILIFF